MKKSLPVPVAEAGSYLNDEQLKRYKEAFDTFYSPDLSYSTIDTALRLFLPKDCEAAKDLAMKRYQIRMKRLDLDLNEARESLKTTSSPKLISDIIGFIQGAEHTKEVARKEAREYGIEIPG